MPRQILTNSTSKWPVVSARIPPELADKLKRKYPDRGKKQAAIRSLIQMHLDGKIGHLEFTHREIV